MKKQNGQKVFRILFSERQVVGCATHVQFKSGLGPYLQMQQLTIINCYYKSVLHAPTIEFHATFEQNN